MTQRKPNLSGNSAAPIVKSVPCQVRVSLRRLRFRPSRAASDISGRLGTFRFPRIAGDVPLQTEDSCVRLQRGAL